MGEIAEMMLDGTLCEGCGIYLGANAPDRCFGCKGFFSDDEASRTPVMKKAKKVRCPTCSRMVKATGLNDHNRVMHSKTPNV